MESRNNQIALGELTVLIKRGIAPRYDERDGTLVLNQRCIRAQKIDWRNARRNDTSQKPIPKDRYVHLFDVLVNSTGVGTLGRVGQITDEPPVATVDSHVTILRPNSNLIDPYYFGFAIRCREKLIESLGEGTTGQTELSRSKLEEILIDVPSIEDQKNISRILGVFDDKIELNRRMNQTLEATAQAIFKSWFVDFEPVKAKAAAAAAGASPEAIERAAMAAIAGKPESELDNLTDTQRQSLAHTAGLFPATFQDSDLGEIPEGWSGETASNHLDAVRGFSYKGAGLAKSGTAMHNLNSVHEGGGYKYEGLKFYTEGFKEKHAAVPGDVIVANTEQGFDHLLIGYGAMIPKSFPKGFFSHHLYRIRPKPDSPLTPYFILHLFLPGRFRSTVAGFTNGTTVNMLPPAGLQMPQFCCPPKSLIQEFSGVVEPHYDSLDANVSQSRTLAELRDALLPKLLSGEINLD